MTTRRIRIADAEPEPTEYPIAFEIEVINETSIDDDPAQIEATVTNRSQDPVELYGGPEIFPRSFSEESDPGLILFLPGKIPGRVLRHGDQRPSEYALGGVLQRHNLDPGTSKSSTLDVLGDDPANPPGRLPEGNFTFRATFGVSVDNADGPIEGEFDWGFSITVEPIR